MPYFRRRQVNPRRWLNNKGKIEQSSAMRQYENRIGGQWLSDPPAWPRGSIVSSIQNSVDDILVNQNAVKFAKDSYNVNQAPAGILYHPRTFKDWSPEYNLLR